jgi:hypothetical protein
MGFVRFSPGCARRKQPFQVADFSVLRGNTMPS